MRRLAPDAETRRQYAPVLARLLLWVAYAAVPAAVVLGSFRLMDGAAAAAMASAVIYARAWSAAAGKEPHS
jgi:hypothetical protein